MDSTEQARRTGTEAQWKYDARQDHPWTERYRLPVVGSPYPRWAYHVAVVVADGPWEGIEPTEDEARILGSFLEYTIDRWYNRQWIAKMREAPFDLDGGTNTMTFLKKPDGNWTYRRMTWTHGPWPFRGNPRQFPRLVDLLDHIEDPIPERWETWKAAHPEVFSGGDA